MMDSIYIYILQDASKIHSNQFGGISSEMLEWWLLKRPSACCFNYKTHLTVTFKHV